MILANKSWKKRKGLLLGVIAIMISTVIFFSFLSCALAGPNYDISDDDDEEESDTITLDDLFNIDGDEIISLVDTVFGYTEISVGTYSEGNTTGFLTRLTELYQNEIFSNTAGIMQALGILMLVIVVCVKAVQEFSRADPTLEMFMRLSIIFLVGILLINYYEEVLTICDLLGRFIVTGLHSGADDVAGISVDEINDLPWWQRIVSFLCLAVGKFTIVIPCWQIIYEMAIRRMFLPVAVSDCVAEGINSPGVRFIKNYFGCYLRIGICYVVAALMMILLNSALSSVSGLFLRLLSTIGIIFGGCGMMTKGQSFVKEALGS